MTPHATSADPETTLPATREQPHRGLLLIGLFKLGKAIFFFALGIGAFHLLHKDLGDEVMRLATALRFDPEGKIVSIGAATFAYSAIALTEGYGLMRQKPWGEYLTLGLTIAFLPWEVYELARELTWIRALLLLTNILVVVYLVWLLRSNRAKREA
jgi:uncharacterized membrane protein (DUF2068 family)